jgi:hypothetical protein
MIKTATIKAGMIKFTLTGDPKIGTVARAVIFALSESP